MFNLRTIILAGVSLVSGLGLFVPIYRVSAFPLGQVSLTSTLTPAPSSPTPTLTRSLTPDPKSRTYVVENGDTLWTIAQKIYGNGSKYTLIQRANGLGDRTKLQTGMILIVPMSDSNEAIGGPLVKLPVPSTSPEPIATPLLKPLPVVPPESTVPVVAPPNTESQSDPAAESAKPTAIKKTTDPLVSYITLMINVLSGIFFTASMLCAYMSFDIYRRSRGYVYRRQISARILAGL
jgi:LysM repeat protein